MMKFPYGTADFYKIRKEGYFYQDRTAYIHLIENWGDQLIFLRPRRFGKSLWLSILENYYDVVKTNEFQELFGDLTIGQNPTPLHNQYFILRWDFSKVAASGEVQEITKSLHKRLNAAIDLFADRYQNWLKRPITLDPTDAIASFQSLLTTVSSQPYKVYLLIDEYDNFANEIAMGGAESDTKRYERMVTGDGALKTVFKTIKASMGESSLDRVFITGVSPMLLTDLTSGFNTATDISLERQLHGLCGFTESEVASLVQQVGSECHYSQEQITRTIELMQTYYNGYSFRLETNEKMYNPTLSLYFLRAWQRECKPPTTMLDANLNMDKNKLNYLANRSGSEEVILKLMNDDPPLSLSKIADNFSLTDFARAELNRQKFASLLFYLGLATLGGENADEELLLTIPNLVTRELYFEQLIEILVPNYRQRDDVYDLAKQFLRSGDPQPLFSFAEEHIFPTFSNRDYKDVNEFALKCFFIALLYHRTIYITESEPELERLYGDLLMLVRPKHRGRNWLDILMEFKYLKLKNVKLDARTIREMSQAELEALPEVQDLFQQANTQLLSYKDILEKQIDEVLNLRIYSVVSLGFERLLWQQL